MTFSIKKMATLSFLTFAVSACERIDKTQDSHIDQQRTRGGTIALSAGIWVDPEGCQHWIVDDGVEGYLGLRLDPYGKPLCYETGQPRGTARGGFKDGGGISDFM